MRTDRRNPAESLCFWTYCLTWPLYFIGALYIVGPVLGWSLFGLSLLSLYLGRGMRKDLRGPGRVPAVVWSWLLGMSALLVILWVGHLNWNLGVGETIKSSIGWAKGWALAAVFPFAGAVLPIGRRHLIRAMSIVGLCTLLLLPLFLISPLAGLPSRLFVSPLSIVGGPGPEYFTLFLYTIDPEKLTARWQFFAPWAPFAGLIGVVAILFALEESKRGWAAIGIAGGLAQIMLSSSRMSLVAVVICVVVPRMAPLVRRSAAWMALSGIAATMAVLGAAVLNFIQGSVLAFKNARASSSRVRSALQRIAFDRWRKEAPWFGHGTVERGPHLVEHMPIGSHHTWFGLLFVKGALGVVSLALPMIHQTWVTASDAARGPRGRLPFALTLLLINLTFGENLEIEVYLLWPAFLMLGIHAREVMVSQAQAAPRRVPDATALNQGPAIGTAPRPASA